MWLSINPLIVTIVVIRLFIDATPSHKRLILPSPSNLPSNSAPSYLPSIPHPLFIYRIHARKLHMYVLMHYRAHQQNQNKKQKGQSQKLEKRWEQLHLQSHSDELEIPPRRIEWLFSVSNSSDVIFHFRELMDPNQIFGQLKRKKKDDKKRKEILGTG